MNAPLTLAEKKVLFQQAVSDTALALFPKYIEELHTEGTSEDIRKYMVMAMEVCNFKEAAPKDQYANLSTTSINIIMKNHPSVGMTIENGQPSVGQSADTQVVTIENGQSGDVIESIDISTFSPSAVMLMSTHINSDIEDD